MAMDNQAIMGKRMFTKLNSISFLGLRTIPVEIEVDIQVKVPEFEVVGMAELSVRESVKRIESAIQNSGFHFPGKRIIVNLAPAGIKKAGALFDLPIALGILNERFEFGDLADHVIVGELSLDGHVRPIHGALPIAMKAKQMGLKKVVCPSVNAGEMGIVEGIDIIPVHSLNEAVEYFNRTGAVKPYERGPLAGQDGMGHGGMDMSDIKGQNAAKRALEVCAAGGHNALMIGPPGTGLWPASPASGSMMSPGSRM
jgi:magnesium chelatase family protein